MSSYEYNFQDRMRQGKELAHERRQRGLPDGTAPAAGWVYRRPDPTGLDRIQWEYDSWRKEWQYACLAAVETELFAHEWEGL